DRHGRKVVNGKLGQQTYAGVVGRGVAAKSGKEKEQMVTQPLPATEIKRCDELKKSIPQVPPLLPAKSKIRAPLRFFPNENPISEKRILGSGLKISVNELGVRRVSRDFKVAGMPREKWVPKVSGEKPKDVGQSTKAQVMVDHLMPKVVGSSTYEVGEASGVSKCGPCEGPEGSIGMGFNQTTQVMGQPDSSNRVWRDREWHDLGPPAG
ncbi:hypothetical protein FCV25MIE_14239, partial [Fagus crenata]